MNTTLRRCLVALAVTLTLGQSPIAPAAAMSTAQEVAQGKAQSAQVDAHSIKVTDPFLVSWVNSVGGQLALHRQRRDINFSFTILNEPDINAFAMKGGFIHVDMGLLNFVSSDDELAATMGHEMGHVELRHVVKSDAQDNAIGILAAIASILSPIAGVLGNIGGELAAEKFSRTDELQADHYGERLAAQSGYDPQAAVDVMAKLGAMDPGPGSKADKAFIDHPVPQDRISHLLGYPELNHPTDSVIIAEAIHDQAEGRYSYAQAKLKKVADPSQRALVAEHQSQLDYAMRESGALAAPDGRVALASIEPNDPRRQEAVAALKAAVLNAQSAQTQAKTDDRLGAGELQNLEDQLNRVSSAMQNQSQGQAPAGPTPSSGPGSVVASALAHLDADISGTVAIAGDVLQTAPGLFGPNQDTMREMSEPLDDAAPLTPKYQALFAFYPSMTAGINKSNNQILDSIAQARAAIDQGITATRMLGDMVNATPPPTPSGKSGTPPVPRLPSNFSAVLSAWDAALAKAQHASDEVYAAQAIDLSAEITLLDVQSSPERYAAFAHALQQRFPGEMPPTYTQATRLGIPPGEIACGLWYAYDTHEQAQSVLNNFKNSSQSCEDAALARHLMGESLEIAEGLVYEDYTDAPQAVH